MYSLIISNVLSVLPPSIINISKSYLDFSLLIIEFRQSEIYFSSLKTGINIDAIGIFFFESVIY